MSASTQRPRLVSKKRGSWLPAAVVACGLLVCLGLGLSAPYIWRKPIEAIPPAAAFEPRVIVDESGLTTIQERLQPWQDPNSLTEIRAAFDRVGYHMCSPCD